MSINNMKHSKTRKIGLIGYGELGRQIELLLFAKFGPGLMISHFDDVKFKQKETNSYSFESYKDEKFKDIEFYVCLGYKQLTKKLEIINELNELKRKLPVFIHHSSYVSESASVLEGTIIYPMCNIDKNVTIGKGTLINNSVTLSHDNVIGDCCYISPGVITSGNVHIGFNTFVGASATFSNGVTIGDRCIIGIGSSVTRDIDSEKSAIGNPIKILKKQLRLL